MTKNIDQNGDKERRFLEAKNHPFAGMVLYRGRFYYGEIVAVSDGMLLLREEGRSGYTLTTLSGFLCDTQTSRDGDKLILITQDEYDRERRERAKRGTA